MCGRRRHKFRQVEHTADKAIEAEGENFGELLESAAYGMFSLIADLEGLEPQGWEEVEVEGAASPEDLLHDFLDELLYRHEVERKVYCRFEVLELDPEAGRLRARAGYGPLDSVKDRVFGYVKAVTYHNLEIRRDDGGYRVTVVFDT